MHEHTVVIRWPGATERVHLGNLKDLRIGDELVTIEKWKDFDPVRYITHVVAISSTGGLYNIRLKYGRGQNSGSALQNTDWGVSKITVDVDSSIAEAYWYDDRPKNKYDTPANANLIAYADYEDLERTFSTKLSRKQKRFRENLIALDQRCVLSGDDTPFALEAAHIVGVRGKGGSSVGNGFILRADLHRLFDAGVMIIRNDGSVSFKRKSKVSTEYRALASDWNLPKEVLKRVIRRLRERNAGDA